MKVRLQSGDVRVNPVDVDGLQLVVIFDDYDQPVGVWCKQADGVIWTSTVKDDGFQPLVRELGLLSRRSVVTDISDLPSAL